MLFRSCCCKRTDSGTETTNKSRDANSQGSSSNPNQNSEFLFRKRSNSEQFLKKVSKKKRRKDLFRASEDVIAFKPPVILNPSSNSSAAAEGLANAPTTHQSTSNIGISPGNRVYPSPSASVHTNAGGNGVMKSAIGESQNFQGTTNDNVSVNDAETGSGGQSASASTNSLDKIKASKIKSSKSFAFWK